MLDYTLVNACLQLGGEVKQVADEGTGEVLPGACYKAHKGPVEYQGKVTAYKNGRLFEVSYPKQKAPQKGGGVRGKITGFSRSSRRRFMYTMAKVDQRGVLPLFATLTYPDEWVVDRDRMERDFRAMRRRIKRKGWGSFWRREWKPRESGLHVGEYYPHYHLLVWGVTLQEFIPWVTVAWWEVCGRLSENHLKAGTNVRSPNSWRQVTAYVSKYMAKLERMPEGFESLGRSWGVINREAIPWSEIDAATVGMPEVHTLFRYMRRYAGLKARGGQRSMKIFCNDPSQWFANALRC